MRSPFSHHTASPGRWLGFVLGVISGVAAICVSIAQFTAALTNTQNGSLADLHVYRGSVDSLLSGASLYDFTATNGDPFTYPPFAGIFFLPCATMPEVLLQIAWTVTAVVSVATLAAMAHRAARLPATAAALPVTFLALLLSGPISSDIRLGQVSLFLVIMVLLDCLGIVPLRFRGILTGVASAIKLTPIIFIAYLWFSGQRRIALKAAATLVTCTAGSWLILPTEAARFWFSEVRNVSRIGDISVTSNQSLNGVLLRTGLTDSFRGVTTLTVGTGVVAFALFRAVRVYRSGDALTAAIITGAAGIILSPVSWSHHQIWLTLACLTTISRKIWVNVVWSSAVLSIMILPVTSLHLPSLIGFVVNNSRFLLAVAIACVVPFRASPGLAHTEAAERRGHVASRRLGSPQHAPNGADVEFAGCAENPVDAKRFTSRPEVGMPDRIDE